MSAETGSKLLRAADGPPAVLHPCEPPYSQMRLSPSWSYGLIRCQIEACGAVWRCECGQNWHASATSPATAYWRPISPFRAWRLKGRA